MEPEPHNDVDSRLLWSSFQQDAIDFFLKSFQSKLYLENYHLQRQ